MKLLPIKIEGNKNFFFDENRHLRHRFGAYVGEPRYRFQKYTKEEQEKYICPENIKVYKTGVLVEYDSACFDIENELDSYNRNDENTTCKIDESLEETLSKEALKDEWSRSLWEGTRSAPEKMRHYKNKMFFNNSGQMIFNQEDYKIFGTLIGEELVHFCDSKVTITDKGIEVNRKNISKNFPEMSLPISTSGNNGFSGDDIIIDNSKNAKEHESFTYEELNEKYKQNKMQEEQYWKKKQEDYLWNKKGINRFYNCILGTEQNKKVQKTYQEHQNALKEDTYF